MPIYQTILLVVALMVLIGAFVLRAVTRKRHPAKACAQCGKPSSHGYSREVEAEAGVITPLCVNCLTRRLSEDYRTFDGRAVVVQPVTDFPCYVFRPMACWGEAVRTDAELILALLETRFHSFGVEARYAWINALESKTVAKLPKLGIKQTLLMQPGAHPVALCAKCTVQRIGRSLREQEGGYLEVSGPRSSEDGVVCGIGWEGTGRKNGFRDGSLTRYGR